ncbi:hypothetical protein NQ318_013517 [Aromia moschata]|uniref:Metallothionein n=1 Tax=Aromia moschata TaxID=1265417 RepID=A0AAV8YDN9_9CUCU|nr:hypothetical protein NQ318_013517 [Aromia moschata]
MSCKDCQCSKNVDQSLSQAAGSLEIVDPREPGCCTAGCSCSCCRPRRRNCPCCSCSACCDCCVSCSSRGGRGCACLSEKALSEPKKVEDIVTSSCKCCAAKVEAAKPKKVCSACGCDKCP